MPRGLFEKPGCNRANEREHRGPSEDVDVRKQGGLLLHQAVKKAE